MSKLQELIDIFNEALLGYEKGNLTYGDISEYLEVKLDHLPKIIERINK